MKDTTERMLVRVQSNVERQRDRLRAVEGNRNRYAAKVIESGDATVAEVAAVWGMSEFGVRKALAGVIDSEVT